MTGKLDHEIIRRIVRAHVNEVRYCYEQGIGRDAKLGGRVSIEFVIAATGKVNSSRVVEDTLSDPAVGVCVGKAVERWKFPKPSDGADVTVVYPFALDPG